MLSVVVEVNNMTKTVQLMRKPDGSQQFPSRSCCDLKEQYPEKPSGEDADKSHPMSVTSHAPSAGTYWIDPNGGHPADAFTVRCDFDGDNCATCIEMKNVLFYLACCKYYNC